MSYGYTAVPWLGFGGALAAIAGALTGLLFVAVSVKSDVLAASRSLRSRAAQTLVLFMISVLTGLFLVAPQPPVALGSELLALAAISGVVLRILDRRAGRGSAQAVVRYFDRFSPNLITTVLVGVTGLTFILKSRWRLVLADPGRCGESRWRCGERVVVPRKGDQRVRLTQPGDATLSHPDLARNAHVRWPGGVGARSAHRR
jgi:hypothetical protein